MDAYSVYLSFTLVVKIGRKCLIFLADIFMMNTYAGGWFDYHRFIICLHGIDPFFGVRCAIEHRRDDNDDDSRIAVDLSFLGMLTLLCCQIKLTTLFFWLSKKLSEIFKKYDNNDRIP